jgi:hypothetical protein
MRLGHALDAGLAGLIALATVETPAAAAEAVQAVKLVPARLQRSSIPVDVTFTQGKSLLGLN